MQMHEKVMSNIDILNLCLEAFDEGRTVSLPNGRFFPPANISEREIKRKEMERKIRDYGKEYVVMQNDNRGLIVSYVN